MTRALRLFTALFTLSFMMTVLPLSQAVAATPYGDLLKNSMAAQDFHYTASGDFKIFQGAVDSFPTDVIVEYAGEGGKQAQAYAEEGNLQFTLSGFDDLPPVLTGLTEVNISMGYRSLYEEAGKTAMMEVTALRVDSDAPVLDKLLGAVKEWLKFFVGKVYRVSQEALEASLEQYIGALGESPIESGLFQSLTQSKLTNAEKSEALGRLLDGLIESGIVQVAPGSTDTNHVLTLGITVTKAGVPVYKNAILDFLTTLNPEGDESTLQPIKKQSTQQLYRSINSALKKGKKAKASITIQEQDGKIQSIDFNLDLRKMGYPITATGTVTYDYSRGFTVTMTQDQNQIIDFNVILDGVLSIQELMAQAFIPADLEEGYNPLQGY